MAHVVATLGNEAVVVDVVIGNLVARFAPILVIPPLIVLLDLFEETPLKLPLILPSPSMDL